LILDDFEHLVAGAGLISRLLEAGPGVDVVVTSREALRLRGEHRMAIAPLAPADAAELFIERARAVRPDAIEEPDDHAAVDRICQRLDGLPLALELAAARVALFSMPVLNTRLSKQQLDLPEGPRDAPDRQRTLRATIDWSYRLLSAAEQALFRELACFAGGARLDAIEAVHNDPATDATQTIAALIDKSLLRRRDDPDGRSRFSMLETIRERRGMSNQTRRERCRRSTCRVFPGFRRRRRTTYPHPPSTRLA
jgi:predicted ATPase